MSTTSRVYKIYINDFRPALDNELMRRGWWRKAKLKKRDRDVVAYEAWRAGVPQVAVSPQDWRYRKVLGLGALPGDPQPRRRRVSLSISNPHYRGRNVPDPLSPLKSLLDALVGSGLLVDDSDRWCEIVVPVEYTTGPKSTTITLEDLG